MDDETDPFDVMLCHLEDGEHIVVELERRPDDILVPVDLEPTAKRIDLLGVLEHEAEASFELVEADACVDVVRRRIDRMNRVDLVLVELVTNLADDLFKQIFERDEAGRAAIFVEDDGDMRPHLAHLFQCIF